MELPCCISLNQVKRIKLARITEKQFEGGRPYLNESSLVMCCTTESDTRTNISRKNERDH